MRRLLRFGLGHWLILSAILGLILLAMTTDFLERMFVYFPEKGLEVDPSTMGLPFLDVHATAEDGVGIHGWFFPRPGAPITLLILHGNAGNISHRLGWVQVLRALDAHIMIIDYRGYGRSEGKPFEEGLYLDARAAYEWWRGERATDKSKIILVGESLGGAVAVDLAAKVPVDGIILQSTFTSARDMASTMFPIGLLRPLMRIRFDSAAKIPLVRCPKLIIHGNRDEIVPYHLARKLYELAAPPKTFYEVRGAGHNDLLLISGAEYIPTLQAFLSNSGL